MFEVLLKRTTPLLLTSALFVLNGCASPAPQMTPESLGATPAAYRGHHCEFLKKNIQEFEKKMVTENDKRVSQWHIDAMRQVREEKKCDVQQAPANVSAAPAGVAAQGMIGLRANPVSASRAKALGLDSRKGALVIEAVKGLPGEKAGIKAMDVVLKIAGHSVSSPQELINLVKGMHAGDKVNVELWRDRKIKTVVVVIGNASALNAQAPATKKALPSSPSASTKKATAK